MVKENVVETRQRKGSGERQILVQGTNSFLKIRKYREWLTEYSNKDTNVHMSVVIVTSQSDLHKHRVIQVDVNKYINFEGLLTSLSRLSS